MPSSFRHRSAKYLIDSNDEVVIVPTPPAPTFRSLVRFRFLNLDTVSRTPLIRIRDSDIKVIDAGLEYVDLYPAVPVGAGEFFEDIDDDIYVFGSTERLVFDLQATANTPPLVLLTWRDHL